MKFRLSYTNPLAPSLGLVTFLVTSSKIWDAYWDARVLTDMPTQIEQTVVATGTITLSFVAAAADYVSLCLIASLLFPKADEKGVCP